ncbi:hypothetical protein BS47DRAFT_1362401 [Hydnum rufescens UP504]|uniref:Uncharacterized protein n=1 Tax=Hydnum rufescens UP504 TaxID=1448309 RepID=A0A9P6AXD6_9AGAM|nr:hypothetical protein BS47DRAFT_1362401 [Hydnum rufescens UP504]
MATHNDLLCLFLWLNLLHPLLKPRLSETQTQCDHNAYTPSQKQEPVSCTSPPRGSPQKLCWYVSSLGGKLGYSTTGLMYMMSVRDFHPNHMNLVVPAGGHCSGIWTTCGIRKAGGTTVWWMTPHVDDGHPVEGSLGLIHVPANSSFRTLGCGMSTIYMQSLHFTLNCDNMVI